MRGWKQGDGFWQGKKAENVLISFLTSGFAVFICLWLLVLPNSNNLINHVLYIFSSSFYDNQKTVRQTWNFIISLS